MVLLISGDVAAEPIRRGDHDHVTGARVLKERREFRARGAGRRGGLLGADSIGRHPCGEEGVALRVEGLMLRAHSRVPEDVGLTHAEGVSEAADNQILRRIF